MVDFLIYLVKVRGIYYLIIIVIQNTHTHTSSASRYGHRFLSPHPNMNKNRPNAVSGGHDLEMLFPE